MSGIMDFFRFGGSNPQFPQDPNGAPANITGNVPLDKTGAPANPEANPSNQNPRNFQPNNQEPNPPVDPLTAMADIWKLPEADPNAPAAPKSMSDFSFGFKAEDIQKNAAKLDFTKSIPQDVLTKMMGGSEQERMAAFMQALNIVGQQAFVNASLVGAKAAETGIRTAGSQFESNLPTFIKQHQVSDVIRSDNAFFSSEAAAPIVAVIEQQVLAKHPNATADQIREHTRNWMKSFMTEGLKHLAPPATQNSSNPTVGAATDFSTWET